jgi:hypothetical protein
MIRSPSAVNSTRRPPASIKSSSDFSRQICSASIAAASGAYPAKWGCHGACPWQPHFVRVPKSPDHGTRRAARSGPPRHGHPRKAVSVQWRQATSGAYAMMWDRRLRVARTGRPAGARRTTNAVSKPVEARVLSPDSPTPCSPMDASAPGLRASRGGPLRRHRVSGFRSGCTTRVRAPGGAVRGQDPPRAVRPQSPKIAARIASTALPVSL